MCPGEASKGGQIVDMLLIQCVLSSTRLILILGVVLILVVPGGKLLAMEMSDSSHLQVWNRGSFLCLIQDIRLITCMVLIVLTYNVIRCYTFFHRTVTIRC